MAGFINNYSKTGNRVIMRISCIAILSFSMNCYLKHEIL